VTPEQRQQGKGQPDIVSRPSNLPAQADKFPHCIGEVKTPWAHDIDKMSQTTRLGGNFRRLLGQYRYCSLTSLTFTLGQIVKYMLDEQRKYGFITTYEQTIFLKQELVGKEWVLFISHVFDHTVRSISPQSGERSFGPGDLREKVSVRLAMLTLLWLSRTKEDYFANNTTPNWVVPEGLLDLERKKDRGLFKTV
jgi:hypothetical protein